MHCWDCVSFFACLPACLPASLFTSYSHCNFNWCRQPTQCLYTIIWCYLKELHTNCYLLTDIFFQSWHPCFVAVLFLSFSDVIRYYVHWHIFFSFLLIWKKIFDHHYVVDSLQRVIIVWYGFCDEFQMRSRKRSDIRSILSRLDSARNCKGQVPIIKWTWNFLTKLNSFSNAFESVKNCVYASHSLLLDNLVLY